MAQGQIVTVGKGRILKSPGSFLLSIRMEKKVSWTLWPPPLSPIMLCTGMGGYFWPVSGSFSCDLELNTLYVEGLWCGATGQRGITKVGEIPGHMARALLGLCPRLVSTWALHQQKSLQGVRLQMGRE